MGQACRYLIRRKKRFQVFNFRSRLGYFGPDKHNSGRPSNSIRYQSIDYSKRQVFNNHHALRTVFVSAYGCYLQIIVRLCNFVVY